MKSERLRMKSAGLLRLFVLLALFGVTFAACEETEEVSVYDNWQERNEAYIDSVATYVGNRYIVDQEDADAMELGQMWK